MKKLFILIFQKKGNRTLTEYLKNNHYGYSEALPYLLSGGEMLAVKGSTRLLDCFVSSAFVSTRCPRVQLNSFFLNTTHTCSHAWAGNKK